MIFLSATAGAQFVRARTWCGRDNLCGDGRSADSPAVGAGWEERGSGNVKGSFGDGGTALLKGVLCTKLVQSVAVGPELVVIPI